MRSAVKAAEAAKRFPDGARRMIGGFLAVGMPERVTDVLVERRARGPAVIANNTTHAGRGIGKLIDAGCVARVIGSHIGTNPVTQRKMLAGDIEVELMLQGTLAERIRAGGASLGGGVLTPTGVGTLVTESKQVFEVEGQEFLLEPPLRADFVLIHAHEANYYFNLTYCLAAANFKPIMALAAGCVIAEPDEILPLGAIPSDAVRTSGILLHHLVERRC